MPSRSQRALTLVELLVAAYMLLVGICGILLLFTNAMTSTESSWDITIATSHAESILEEMQNIKTLPLVKSQDWDKWLEAKGLKTLPQEVVHIKFGEIIADPLDIKLEISWERKLKPESIILETRLTK